MKGFSPLMGLISDLCYIRVYCCLRTNEDDMSSVHDIYFAMVEGGMRCCH
jgi:hypothetical protein